MFAFHNLNDDVRRYMADAISEAESSGNVYFSKYFTARGRTSWTALLREAALHHNEHWLALQLDARAFMSVEGEPPLGSSAGVPSTAATTIAEGQFNRFYMLGLCRKAKAVGITQLTVYRAKQREEARPHSQALVGTTVNVADVEAQLKKTTDSFRSPLLKVHSGLSLKL